jgi:hypothetical protein
MKSNPAYSTKKTISGYTVYPCTYGHIHWLMGQKNPVFTQKGKVDDYALAEICYAFTVEPSPLQSIKGAIAKKKVNDFLINSTTKPLMDLWKHAMQEIELFYDSMTVPKKAIPQVQKSRKPAISAKKR